MASFVKKIVTVVELESLFKDITETHFADNEVYGHTLGLKHDPKLILKSLSHESILIWNIHVWGHFNGEKWDGMFIANTRRSEKFNKKMMEEYLWLSKGSMSGMKLYRSAVKFAKQNGCEFLCMSVVDNHPFSNKLKKTYETLGFQKDCETYIKRL